MSTRVEQLTDIPTADLDMLADQFEAAGGSVIVIRQRGGHLWTIVATFETP